MAANLNAPRWNGRPGHYEVHYLTLTDPRSGVGIWIRYTMLAPVDPTGDPPTCSLWFLAMDPRQPGKQPLARKTTFEIADMRSQADPFELRIGEAVLSDNGMQGGFEDVAWDLRWTPSPKPYKPVDPLLGRLGLAKTVFVLPHADLTIDGHVEIGDERLELTGVRGAQAHLWGSEHARSWAWLHCNDLADADGEPVPGFVESVSAIVSRFGREIGPNTPVVGRIAGSDFISTSPRRILSNQSTFGLNAWRFEAVSGSRRLVAEVEAPTSQLAGVTYHDPDGSHAYCYNSEIASLELTVHERSRRGGGWQQTQRLQARGRAHFEYGQRVPISQVPLLLQ
jgi:hypothetical protein